MSNYPAMRPTIGDAFSQFNKCPFHRLDYPIGGRCIQCSTESGVKKEIMKQTAVVETVRAYVNNPATGAIALDSIVENIRNIPQIRDWLMQEGPPGTIVYGIRMSFLKQAIANEIKDYIWRK